MKNLFYRIVEHFQASLYGLFITVCLILSGHFGGAIFTGIFTAIITIILITAYKDEFKRYRSRNNSFRKWTKGK